MIAACDVYNKFCETVNIQPVHELIDVSSFSSLGKMAEQDLGQRLTAALGVLIDLLQQDTNDHSSIDRTVLDYYIAKLDQKIATQLDEIMHHPEFQALESSWRGLKYLTDEATPGSNIKIELLDCEKQSLANDFLNADSVQQSGLYKHVYIDEYDTPGGEPIATIIGDYKFSAKPNDLELLESIAKVAAYSHSPFLASTSAEFFQKKTFSEVAAVEDLTTYMDKADYIHWNQFRETELARHIGLTMPRFLLRAPYSNLQNSKSFNYSENCFGEVERYLWGNSSFAFAANMLRSFKDSGWMVNIRGSASGGRVLNLPLQVFDDGLLKQVQIPTETLIPENFELTLSQLGFIPLSYYKNTNYACFFSANSIQKPGIFLEPEITANAKMNARLPYIFLTSRIAHYLKVFQRETIGTNKSQVELENELNTWLQGLVTKMNNPDPELAAQYPLKEGLVKVYELVDDPGFYGVNLSIVPHFQVEGVDVRLALVAQLPREQDKE